MNTTSSNPSQTTELVKELWAKWDIRVFMLVSLSFQAFLTFLAPLRKRNSSGLFSFSMWLLYLSADAVALYTIGLISSGQGDNCGQDNNHLKPELLAFWAPFLLLHLGGPDTITALALEDNELWHRHALQFVTQVGVTVYVFAQTFRHGSHMLWLPTMFMFVDGCIKYVERICALYFASADAFRESVAIEPESGPSYAWLMEEYYAALNAGLPANLQRRLDPTENNQSQGGGDIQEDLDLSSSEGDSPNRDEATITSRNGLPQIDEETTNEITPTSETEPAHLSRGKEAYYFYSKFKGLLADALLSWEDRKESRDFYLKKPGLEALELVEIELNLIYDVFYTKAFLLQRKRAYLRALTSIAVVTTLLLFALKYGRKYDGIDLGITYALIGGAIALDVLASIQFILSDWWIVIISRDDKSIVAKISLFLSLKNWLKRCKPRDHNRWSRSISQYNLLKRCLKDPPSIVKLLFVKRLRDALIGWLYGDCVEVDDQLLNFIVSELNMKASFVAEDANAIKEVCSARGNLVLQPDYSLISEYLYPWTMGIDYDESLLTWHFATDICYANGESRQPDETGIDYRKISKVLSDYMSYLLLTKQAMLSPVAGKSDMLFEDTRGEVKKLMRTKMTDLSVGINEKAVKFISGKVCGTTNEQEHEFLDQFCKRVLDSYVRPMMDKGDKSKYVLFSARHLAQQLNMIGEKQWEIMSKVWLELLCYAATRCTPRSHVAQLSKGGELITLVWLYMAHLGLGECFLQNQGLRWTKLVIPK